MPLNIGYGVLIGTLHDYYRDPPDDFGRYYHGNLVIHTPAGNYKCAIDVDPKSMPDGIQWRTVRLRAPDFVAISALADGWHPLDLEPTSGALDFIRSAVLHPPVMIHLLRYSSCLNRVLSWLRWNPPWKSGTGFQALTELETDIDAGTRFFVFGEPFSNGLGGYTTCTRTRATRSVAATTRKTGSGRTEARSCSSPTDGCWAS